MRGQRALVGIVTASLLAAVGCSDNSGGTTACVPNKQEACACFNGTEGVQICGVDGTWGPCEGCQGDGDVAGGPDAEVQDDAATSPDGAVGDGGTVIVGSDVVITSDTIPEDVVVSDHCEPCGYGELRGIVCAPTEQIFISHADVRLSVTDCDGSQVTLTTRSSADGTFYFPQVPCGQHLVYIEAGQFRRDYIVNIQSGGLTDITAAGQKQCFKANQAKIAIFWGQWDRLQMLIQQLGFDFTYYNFEFDFFNDTHPDDIEALQVLRDPVQLGQYDIIFFNCGSAALKWVNGYPEITTNLRDFVNDGGSLFASDLAWAYLEAPFPNAVDYYGTTDLPSQSLDPDGPQRVMAHQSVAATVEDPDMAEYLGTSTFTAEFGSGPLIGVDAGGSNTTVHVRGLVKIEDESLQGFHIEGQPLVLSSQPQPGAGRIIYTSFHNDEQADTLIQNLLYYLVFRL